MQFWTSTVAAPTRAAAVAQRAEAEGWDGVGVVDSQNLSGDPYICLALGATATETLGLQTSVTNPVTPPRRGNGIERHVCATTLRRTHGASHRPRR